MKRSFIISGVVGLSFVFQVASAQTPSITPSVLNASGGYGHIGSILIDYSIGEMTLVGSTYTDSAVVTQGLLQNDFSIPVKVTTPTANNNIQVFPNPAYSFLNLEYTTLEAGTLTYRLIDVLGSVVTTEIKSVSTGMTREAINISDLAAATYFLEVTFEAQGSTSQTTTYQIQKLK